MRDKKQREARNHPNVQSSKGGINPSAPSTGSASWGATPDEKHKQVSQNNPEAESPNARGAGDVRHTSYPQNEAAQNPAAWEHVHTHGDRSFRCADVVQKDCGWSVTGNNEDEILAYAKGTTKSAEEVPGPYNHGKNLIRRRQTASWPTP